MGTTNDKNIQNLLAQKISATPTDSIAWQGLIKLKTGTPVSGASVIIKNFNQGTLTDSTGKFRLNLEEYFQKHDTAKIVVQYINYNRQYFFLTRNEVMLHFWLRKNP